MARKKKEEGGAAVVEETRKQGLDIVGCRPTADSGKINATLSFHRPVSVEKIVEETGLSSNRVQKHLRFWAKRGRLVQSEKGWSLSPSLNQD